MKRVLAGLCLSALVAATGCGSKDVPGGAGATNPAGKPPHFGEADNTFNLTAPSTSLKQGETKAATISIRRGANFQDDVTIKFVDAPQGLALSPATPAIKHGETEATVMLKAAADAALGDFTLKVVGHPTKGGDSSTEFKVGIAKDPEVAARAKRDEYARAMQKTLDDLDAKGRELTAAAARAEGQAKKDLEKKAQEAKVKRDAAAKKLDELKEAAPDRWEKIKDGVGGAFDELKKMFQ